MTLSQIDGERRPDSGAETAAQGSQVSPCLHLHMPLPEILPEQDYHGKSAYGWSLTIQVASAQRKLLVMSDSDEMIWQVPCKVRGGLANGWEKVSDGLKALLQVRGGVWKVLDMSDVDRVTWLCQQCTLRSY